MIFLRLFWLLPVAVHWPACLTSYWCSTVITELNCTIAEPDRQTSEDVRARRLRLLVNCTHSHMGHRRTGSVHLADQDNVAADSQIRPPVCSEYWSVHYLLMSWRPLYMEAICEDNHALGQCTLVIITMTDRWMDHSMLFVKKYDQFIFLFCQFNCISKISHYWWMVSCNSCKNYDNLAVVRCRIWQTDRQN